MYSYWIFMMLFFISFVYPLLGFKVYSLIIYHLRIFFFHFIFVVWGLLQERPKIFFIPGLYY
nr:MAG TPA: hypothetical protein [Caudoviricetes sp.]